MPSTKITEHDMDDSVFSGIMAKLEELSTRGAVRRIQRGTFEMSSYSSDKMSVVTIPLEGFTNVDKMSVHVNWISSASSEGSPTSCYPTSVTTTELELTCASVTSVGSERIGYYEVIEFY